MMIIQRLARIVNSTQSRNSNRAAMMIIQRLARIVTAKQEFKQGCYGYPKAGKDSQLNAKQEFKQGCVIIIQRLARIVNSTQRGIQTGLL